MILSNLKGGLANQLFQWAYGLSLSTDFNTPLYLDISFYDNQVGCTPRSFSLNKFPNLKFEIFEFNKMHSNDFSKLGMKIINDDSVFRKFEYDSNFDYRLNGYWGSEKYFEKNKNIIKSSLSYNDDFIDKIKNSIYRDVLKNNVTSMHIRRTDYVTSNGYHHVQPLSYYENALKNIGEYELLYVFSDDIEWCKYNINFDKILFVEGLDDVEDLWLMSMCRNNITANSTFSWWGAWLNNNPNKKVISPLKWFGPHTNLNGSDVVPETWVKI
jgi:hypothetical protein